MFNRVFDPSILTDEEINELTKLWEEYNISTDYGGNPNHHGGPPMWYDIDYAKPSKRTLHKWKPILLARSTVWNCELCDTKREHAKGETCEEEF